MVSGEMMGSIVLSSGSSYDVPHSWMNSDGNLCVFTDGGMMFCIGRDCMIGLLIISTIDGGCSLTLPLYF